VDEGSPPTPRTPHSRPGRRRGRGLGQAAGGIDRCFGPVALVRKLPAYGVPVAPAQTLIVVGATGDLCGRLLLPALARLYVADELPAGSRFVGAGPQGWDLLTFQDHVRTRLAKFAPDLATDKTDTFVGELSYHHVDVLDPAAFSDLFEDAANGASLTVYLALPTHLIAAAVRAMGLIGRPASLRVAVEKPFGSDLENAEDLNAALARTASDEGHIFRVDHILGMPTVQALPSTLMRLRPQSGASPRPDVTKVSILWEETLALEGRAAFYDRAGALKDLLQNHLLQILCQVTMSSSGESTGGDWSRRRLKALREVQIPTADQARTTTRRARYTAGTLARTGEAAPVEVPDYTAEEGVDASRQTETFAEVSLHVQSSEWSNTRFVLRAGKAMGRRRRGILIQFRQHSHTPGADELWIDLDEPMADAEATSDHLAISSAPLEQIAYINVLRDLLSGSNTLCVSREEADLAWQIFTPTLDQWTAGTVPLETYSAGTTPHTDD